jgi:hypothetical protein
VGTSSANINIIATVFSGDVDLFVSASWDLRPLLEGNFVVNSLISSAEVGSEDLTIPHNMIAEWCKGKSYCYLIVGALGMYEQTPSDYSLVQTIGVTTTLLSSGVPIRGHVDAGFSQFYTFAVTNLSYDVLISTTAFFGDPDIYVSLKPNTFPSGANFTWMTVSKLIKCYCSENLLFIINRPTGVMTQLPFKQAICKSGALEC